MKKMLFLLLACLLLLSVLPAHAEVTVEIEGQLFPADAQELDLSKIKITDQERLESTLLQMEQLTKVDLSYCGLSNEALSDMRARFAERGVKIVWTLRFGRWTLRTDATAFSTLNDRNTKRYGDDTFKVLQYATELRAVDLGHNWIFDVSFLEPLTERRVVILSDNRITDISCLDDKPLEYIEMFNNRVRDISFLSDCDTLIDLNLCNTHVSDLSPLYSLPNLKRVWMGDIDELTQDEINTFLSHQEENLEGYNFFTKYPTEYGWRVNERYEIIKAMFKEGVYMDFDTVLRPDQYVHLFKNKAN